MWSGEKLTDSIAFLPGMDVLADSDDLPSTVGSGDQVVLHSEIGMKVRSWWEIMLIGLPNRVYSCNNREVAVLNHATMSQWAGDGGMATAPATRRRVSLAIPLLLSALELQPADGRGFECLQHTIDTRN